MSSTSVHAHYSAAATKYSISVTFFSIIIFPGTVFLIIREVFTPVGERRPPTGKKWKLPAARRGIPIFGNFLKLRNARNDGKDGNFNVMSLRPYYRKSGRQELTAFIAQ